MMKYGFKVLLNDGECSDLLWVEAENEEQATETAMDEVVAVLKQLPVGVNYTVELAEVETARSVYDYTLEYCPWCDSEQVIYAKGVTACPSCGKPLAPCSMCEECNYKTCPYGCDGSDKDEDKPIDHHITQEEIDWYDKANKEWLKEYQKQFEPVVDNAVDIPANRADWTIEYTQDGKSHSVSCFSKKVIVAEYISLLHSVGNLKVYRNGVDYTERLEMFLSDDEDKSAWNTILSMLAREPRSYDTADDPGYSTNGNEILCSCEAEASIVADFLNDLVSEWGNMDFVTGYYDPVEDAREHIEDDNTGFWYVRQNGA